MKRCDEMKVVPNLRCKLHRGHFGACAFPSSKPKRVAPRGKYEVILADFPWRYTSFGSAKITYDTMSDEEIAAFDWSRFMAKQCAVFTWATGPKEAVAHACYREWEERHGLYYQGLAFIWVKTTLAGAPIKASGPRPRVVKPLGELVHVLTTNPKKRVFPLESEAVQQYVLAPKARRHSEKPKEVAQRIVQLYGDRPRIELFCRGQAQPGWDAWGREAEEAACV